MRFPWLGMTDFCGVHENLLTRVARTIGAKQAENVATRLPGLPRFS